jgi:hypothetical protein
MYPIAGSLWCHVRLARHVTYGLFRLQLETSA